MSCSLPSQCYRCRFNARSPYLVCAVHPAGPESIPCPSFEAIATTPSHGVSQEDALNGRLPAPSNPFEEEWMSFWGPTEAEWQAHWGPENPLA